ncbi:uncharacterized protein [Drosophila kikkawai]|uniref:BESS domain-containing protein n=1 Tax=Drosophila kikkawai TaxID=30033 RepID=A0A6P4I3N7_DROKI|nr:uncharacterized protein LOC108075548 [Drosophila kikkawai]
MSMSLKRNQLRYSKPPPQNRQELLQSIERDRGVLGAYLQKLNSQQEDITTSPASAPLAPSTPSAPVQQRCSYDLFFESACITVKNLPPKLAAEAKSRISQIISEFEIRAIEMEALPHQGQAMGKSRSTGDTLVDDKSEIVYEFHPCP